MSLPWPKILQGFAVNSAVVSSFAWQGKLRLSVRKTLQNRDWIWNLRRHRHLSAGDVGAVFFADPPEWQVADRGQRGQVQLVRPVDLFPRLVGVMARLRFVDFDGADSILVFGFLSSLGRAIFCINKPKTYEDQVVNSPTSLSWFEPPMLHNLTH